MLQEKLRDLPDKPGVYLMKDSSDKIIYVGKAKNLKNRVRQYFQKNSSHGLKVLTMVKNIDDFEIIITDSEVEALILEFNLIKKHLPRFNIMLKDDKSYPFIKVTLNENYPRILMTRKVKKDGARYFGPYTNANAVKQTIDAIEKVYKLKHCSKNFNGEKALERPCLNFFIDRCPGICLGNVDKSEYRNKIYEIIEILKGKDKRILEDLTNSMEKASRELDFENAAIFRDQIQGIKTIGEKQKITSDASSDQDVINFAMESSEICIQVFKIRDGKMIGRETHMLEYYNNEDDFLNQFVKQFYYNRAIFPKEIIIPHEIEDKEAIELWLKEKKGNRVTITVPVKGDKKKLLSMVKENAKILLFEHMNKKYNKLRQEKFCDKWILENMGIEKKPIRIESFDISNIGGKDAVGAMVVFTNYKPDRKAYRRFRIKSVEGQDDYASTQEVIFRRIERGMNEIQQGKTSGSFLPLPDIIMLDGGIGHINSVKKILDMYDLDIKIFGMVKNDKHKLEKLVAESSTMEIPKSTPIYYFLNNLSEEVHRFAVEYHRKIRNEGMSNSVLSKIEGIGPKRQRLLLDHFKSIDNIRNAKLEEFKKVQGINEKTARIIIDYFNEKNEKRETMNEV
ncbi:excinuclease ABC subunit UvrC [Alkalibacter mobilis]|uniref:excinuclease ABC subunit UvrC n=1 Tax=Alkalibacter mobilis TaxID=2787712 RepID=UPI00189D4A9F|nr:excinuclease ABC subunit UvrC [Alkalibacter mobilis]MBF7096494.1 excinuclease ABC subunit UvrC [Alkalibacter mobilis]